MKNKAKVFTLALLVVALFTALMLSACGKTDVILYNRFISH